MGSSSGKPKVETNKTNNSGRQEASQSSNQSTSNKQGGTLDGKPSDNKTTVTPSTTGQDKTSSEKNGNIDTNNKEVKTVTDNKNEVDESIIENEKKKRTEGKEELKDNTTGAKNGKEVSNTKYDGKSGAENVIEDILIDEGPKEQLKFDCAVKSACLLV